MMDHPVGHERPLALEHRRVPVGSAGLAPVQLEVGEAAGGAEVDSLPL